MTEKLIVKEISVNVFQIDDKDYISLKDMLKAKDGNFFISDWLRKEIQWSFGHMRENPA